MIDILIPTKRWNAYTRAFLSYMANIATHSAIELHLHIGDNSCDVDKHQFLKNLENQQVHVYPHDIDKGIYGNINYLFTHSNSPYVQLFGDDDWIHPDWYDNFSCFQVAPELSGVMGSFINYPSEGMQVSQPGDRFSQSDAVARAKDYVIYMLKEVGVNTHAFALRRREDYQIFYNYMTKHPFKYQFHDQLLSQISLLRGPVRSVNNGLIVYNRKLDSFSSALLLNQSRMHDDCGLPAWFGIFSFYLWGVEYATLYQYHELSDDIFLDRKEAADQIFQWFLSQFQLSLEYESFLKSMGLFTYLQDVYDNPTAEQGVVSMQRIVSKINIELGEKYTRFLNTYTHIKV